MHFEVTRRGWWDPRQFVSGFEWLIDCALSGAMRKYPYTFTLTMRLKRTCFVEGMQILKYRLEDIGKISVGLYMSAEKLDASYQMTKMCLSGIVQIVRVWIYVKIAVFWLIPCWSGQGDVGAETGHMASQCPTLSCLSRGASSSEAAPQLTMVSCGAD